jgi:hypothetical protein
MIDSHRGHPENPEGFPGKHPQEDPERSRKKDMRVNLNIIIHQYWMYDYYST